MEIIEEPDGNTAGVGIETELEFVPEADSMIAVCQLWPGGDTDTVYVPKQAVPELCRKLREIEE